MKVQKSNYVYVEVEAGDRAVDLSDAMDDIPRDARVEWVPLGADKVALRFAIPEDD